MFQPDIKSLGATNLDKLNQIQQHPEPSIAILSVLFARRAPPAMPHTIVALSHESVTFGDLGRPGMTWHVTGFDSDRRRPKWSPHAIASCSPSAHT